MYKVVYFDFDDPAQSGKVAFFDTKEAAEVFAKAWDESKPHRDASVNVWLWKVEVEE